jgi:phosphoribosylformylglycinamidine (FGAM) synthase-like amidotransferase family enzyme
MSTHKIKNINITGNLNITGTHNVTAGSVVTYNLSSTITTANQADAFTNNVPSAYQNNIFRVDTINPVTLVFPAITSTNLMITICDSTGNADINPITLKAANNGDTMSGVLYSDEIQFQINGSRNSVTLVSDNDQGNWMFT